MKFYVHIFLALVLLMQPVFAFQRKDNVITLSAMELQFCTTGDGCALVNKTQFAGALSAMQKEAYEGGVAAGEKSCSSI